MNPQISNDLFNKVRSKFSNVSIGDANGEVTADPNSAVFLDFEYNEDSDTFGRMSISLAEDGVMKVFYNKGLTDKIDEDSKTEFFAFLKELKEFAVQHQLGFDVRDITKSNLTKQDYKNLADVNQTVNTADMSEELNRITHLAGLEKPAVAEGLTGTSKSSFENLDKTRLIIRHKGKVDETVPGSRSRQISSMYIENADGERFKYPITHLAGARAMTRHVANGGLPHDEFGQHIVKTSENIAQLASFQRFASNKDQLNDSAGDIIEATKLKLETMRKYVKGISKQKNYESAFENFQPSAIEEMDDETRDSYREKFTLKHFDERVDEVLPLIHDIMKEAPKSDPDAKMEPQIDHGAVVQSFLTNPERKLVLRKDDIADKMLSVTKFTDKRTMLGSILSDIASRMLTRDNDEDRVANFASRVAVDLEGEGELFHKPSEGFAKNKQIAVQLAKRYIDDYKKMKSDPAYKDEVRIDPANFQPKKDRQGKAKEDVQAFENWANRVESRVTEGTWSLPDVESAGPQFEKLANIMDDVLPVGTDSSNAINELSAVGFGDDDLYDDLGALEDEQGPDADARSVVYNYVMNKLLQSENVSGHYSPEEQQDLEDAVSTNAGEFLRKEKQSAFAGESLTFEDIKPYVSMYQDKNGKTVNDVLDKDGNSVFKSHDAKMAMDFLSKNFSKMRSGELKGSNDKDAVAESLTESRTKILTAIDSRADHEIADIVRLAKS